MKIKVLFFGFIHDLTGLREEHVELGEGETLQELRSLYERRFPPIGELAGALLIAVNQQISEPLTVLHEGDEVAFMPPVSGGTDDSFYRLTVEKISASALVKSLHSDSDGAVVTFEGVVRYHSNRRRTLHLEYEAYELMAVRKMQEIGAEARQKFDIHSIGIIHRTGRLEIGETSVAIVVTAAHRRPAFEACQYLIDRLKLVVPIWKKEYFDDGAVWVEGEGQTRVLAGDIPLTAR
ncbi:MAG TPA: molybdenum cofactor biosynthesis protein MoaE [Terriglobia bacterium]|nr:molybdenum cofactor biosynthesis protein MoaE [Terriglobia bacterium]